MYTANSNLPVARDLMRDAEANIRKATKDASPGEAMASLQSLYGSVTGAARDALVAVLISRVAIAARRR